MSYIIIYIIKAHIIQYVFFYTLIDRLESVQLMVCVIWVNWRDWRMCQGLHYLSRPSQLDLPGPRSGNK